MIFNKSFPNSALPKILNTLSRWAGHKTFTTTETETDVILNHLHYVHHGWRCRHIAVIKIFSFKLKFQKQPSAQ